MPIPKATYPLPGPVGLPRESLNGEPMFVLRASDVLAIPALRQYLHEYSYRKEATAEGKAALELMIKQFHDWERQHPTQVQFPKL